MFSPIKTVIDDIYQGKMVVLVDDESRENEGDLVIAAEKADAAAINFMAKYGRGLVCLTLTQDRIKRLNLPLMAHHNQSRHQTAFTVSIEARHGITTGISAADRATTIKAAIHQDATPLDIVSPGHIFPLAAKDGGVLVRAGHTEASVDLARAAGLIPAGVICEIMNDDGTMARLPDLAIFCKNHGLSLARIDDLIKWRRAKETLVQQCGIDHHMDLPILGTVTLKVYENSISKAQHLVLIKGTLTPHPTLVRMHAFDALHDILGVSSLRHGILQGSFHAIAKHGSGVVVMLMAEEMCDYSTMLKTEHHDGQLRAYGIGAQILKDIGVRQLRLLTNKPKPIIGLDGYGLEVVEIVKIEPF
jgi:3,4-dihydroxy 2-butanone 4-phosphate synthase / GTP cyclohydrolase II